MPKPFQPFRDRWRRGVPARGVLLVAFLQWRTSRASNWAQVAGARVQNYAIPNEGGADSPLFSPRAGMALTTTNTTTDTASEWGYSYMVVLGGDSFVKTTDMTAGERGGSYLNDVWLSGGPGLQLLSGGTKPMIESTMKWEEVNPGRIPPVGVTYEEWIICQQGLRYRLDNASVCEDASEAPGIYLSENMWSPRRNHRAVTVGVRMFVLGGRAREVADIARDRTEGGILYPRVENDPFHSSWREPSVLKNDVWASDDKGSTWFLVSPGCHAPQAEDLLTGNEAQGKYGAPENKCTADVDCYGVGECHEVGGKGHATCVCPMWSPRELHAVAAHDSIIYVVGGFVSLRRSNCGDYACGDVDAGAYRGYKSDVWYSSDGRTWDAATLEAGWPGRGDHGLFVYNDVMYLVGGATHAGYRRTRYMNDVWHTTLPMRTTDQPSTWYNNYTTPTWPGRAGHQVALEVPAAINSFSPRVYVIGGHNEGGLLSDTWSWNVSEGEQWSRDYSELQPYRSGVASTTSFVPGPPPQMYYLDRNSNVSMLKRAFLPTFAPFELGSVEEDLRPLVTDEEVLLLAKAGVHTVSDLISADRNTVLNMRGHEIPQICDLRNLAMALVEKCTMDPGIDPYNGEEGQPQNVEPVFSGGKPTKQYAKWYGVDYTVAEKDGGETDDVDVEELIETWDGCTYVEALGDSPYVPGIGEVTQVSSSADISQALEGLHCKINPGARTHAASVYFDQKLILIGGRAGEDELKNDVWYRDDRTPTAFVERRPSSYTSGSEFEFTCDEEVCYYEVRVFDRDENLEVVGWTEVVNSVDVSFLNRWRGGAGNGEYILYVRAVDSAGNTDFSFREEVNMHTWNYVSPRPWRIILPVFFAAILLIAGLYLEYRRRIKMRAMERYAMKRMRRKFKHQQKKLDVNWRDVYKIGTTDEKDVRGGGGGGGGSKKKNKKKKGGRNEREKDKKKDQKRDKKRNKKKAKKKKEDSERTASSSKEARMKENKKEKTSSELKSKSKSRSKSKTPSKSPSGSKDHRSKTSREKDKKAKKSKEFKKREKSGSRERSGTEMRRNSPEERQKKSSGSKSKSTKRSNDVEGGRKGSRRFDNSTTFFTTKKGVATSTKTKNE